MENEQADAGTGRLNPSRETKFSGTYGDRGISTSPVQLIGKLTRLVHTLLYEMDHTYIHIYSVKISGVGPRPLLRSGGVGSTINVPFARRLSEYCERVEILPEEQRGFRTNRATIDMILVIHRLQELARKKRNPLHVCFINLTTAYDSGEQTLLRTVLAHFGVPQNMISVIRRFYRGMRACVCLDDRVCSGWWLVVEQGLQREQSLQRCVLAPPPVQHLRGGYKRGLHAFQGKGIVDALVHLRKKKLAGVSNCRKVSMPLWCML